MIVQGPGWIEEHYAKLNNEFTHFCVITDNFAAIV